MTKVMTKAQRRKDQTISGEAINVYKRMRALKCTCPPRPEDMPYWESPPECPGCAAWSELNNHPAMKALRPLWEVYTVPPPGDCSPFADEEQERQRAFETASTKAEVEDGRSVTRSA
jgi:hypothetical protein